MAGVLRIANAAAKSASCGSSKRGFSALVTPLEEFPGTPVTTPTPSSASTTSTTTLPNGLTVVSEDTNNTCTISLTFPHAGSYSEQGSAEVGASLVNKYLSFKSGSGLSTAVILRNLEDDGATPFATSSRYGASVGFTAARDKAVRLVPLLATTGTFERWDVRDAKKYASIEVDEALTSVQTVLTEGLFSAAYGAQTSAGKSHYSTSNQPTASAIQTFRDRAYGLNGAVLAATGIPDHEAFVEAIQYGFSESPIGDTHSTDETPVFIGGETRVHTPGAGAAHLALGLHMSSCSAALAQVAAMCITDASVSGFATPVGVMGGNGGGIIGAYSGPVSVTDSAAVLDGLCSVLTGPAPSADVVERVKALAKAKALFEMEDGSKNLAEGMTKCVLEYSAFNGGSLSDSISAEYDAVTHEDVKRVFEGMVGGSVPPAIASVGDITSVPYLGAFSSRFS